MSGSIDIIPGYKFGDEPITLEKLDAMVTDLVARIGAGQVTARELADGAINSDKLDINLAAQLGIPEGSITMNKLVDGILENSTAGRAKMADGYLSADAAGRAKMADGFITTALMAGGAGIPAAADALAFRVHLAADQLFELSGVGQVVHLDTEDLDAGGCFNVATYKFTPTIAGVYLITGSCFSTNTNDRYVAIYKNGAMEMGGSGTTVAYRQSNATCLVTMNGTTDYLQLCINTSVTGCRIQGGVSTFLSGILVART